MSLDGGTLTIEPLEARQVREARIRDIPNVRELLAARFSAVLATVSRRANNVRS